LIYKNDIKMIDYCNRLLIWRYLSIVRIYAARLKKFQAPAFSLFLHLFELVQKIKAGDEHTANYDGAYNV
jgi:hypothetical protein